MSNMNYTFFVIGGVDENIIYIHRCIVFYALHHMMHNALEGRGCVHQSEWKHRLFEVISPTNRDWRYERRKRDCLFVHRYLIIFLLEVDL